MMKYQLVPVEHRITAIFTCAKSPTVQTTQIAQGMWSLMFWYSEECTGYVGTSCTCPCGEEHIVPARYTDRAAALEAKRVIDEELKVAEKAARAARVNKKVEPNVVLHFDLFDEVPDYHRLKERARHSSV